MNSYKASSRPHSAHHVLVRSNPVAVDAILDVLARLDTLVSENPEVAERQRFVDRDQIVDATNSFCGACLQPVPLGNFSADSDSTVVLVHYSKWLTVPSELSIEIENSINEVTHWIDQGCSLSSTISYAVSDAVFLGIERSNQSDYWKVWTHPFNEPIKRREVSAATQKQRYGELIQCLGQSFGEDDYRLEIVDGYLEYQDGPNTRLTLCDLNLGIGDPRTHHRLEIQLTDDETPLLVKGLASYFGQLAMPGRVVARMGASREDYENWRRSFAHRDGFYEYLYLGVLRDSVIAYLTGGASKPPVGFVPYAQYRVTGPSRGSVSLSLEFGRDDVTLWISGGESLSEEGMSSFLEAAGLAQLTDESCVVFL